jgi:rod shape-determining protein MreD
MWTKYLFIVFLFYFFALLQNSFFANFNFLGINPNLVFILFILLIFFGKKPSNVLIVFYAIIAGFFLDIFSSIPLGWSILILLIIGFLINKSQKLLFEKSDKHPYVYFAVIFSTAFSIYCFLFNLLVYFITESNVFAIFDFIFLYKILYNLSFASLFFLLYKKFVIKESFRQQKLF